jgi:hypothetical protein
MSMLQLEIYPAQKMFFYDRAGRERIFEGVDRARHKSLNRAGALIRTIARRSLKPARRKSVGEMTDREVSRWFRQLDEWRMRGKTGPKPRRPFAPSKPGEPPRSHVGFLKKFLYYAFDPQSQSVVVGPAALPQISTPGVPGILEYGGVSEGSRIEARPYMRPAEQLARRDYTEVWRDAIR